MVYAVLYQNTELKAKKNPTSLLDLLVLVPEAGLEPALPHRKGILSPPRLPISPLGLKNQSIPARKSLIRPSASLREWYPLR